MKNETGRKYDVSELGAQILASKGTYILYLDIDNLKPINDNMGHDAGDAALAETALAETAARIERSISPGMTFFRTGNDDFTVLTGSGDLGRTESVAAKIISFADDEVTYGGGTLKFSVSIGIASEFSYLRRSGAAQSTTFWTRLKKSRTM
jgi:diguanylate cyclase (GGDEF)-like protein